MEDDIKFALLVSRALQRQGFVTQITGSGDAALRAMRERQPAVAVLDVMIPHPDGIEVCRQFRRDGFDRPIVALSARSAPQDRERALDAGADLFLAKPVPLVGLAAMVLALHEQWIAGDADQADRGTDASAVAGSEGQDVVPDHTLAR